MSAHLSECELADLCALADGSLPDERRAAVEARVAASGELQELVRRQREAISASRMLSADPVPESLRADVEARIRARSARPRIAPGLPRLAAAAAVVVAAIAAAVVLTSGPGAPSVADAAQIAMRPATGPAPAPLPGHAAQLAAGVQGVHFPALATWSGWRASGVRQDRLDGRRVTVVYYGKGNRRIAYAIVAGTGLPRPSDGWQTRRGGAVYQTLRVGGKLAVTWRRSGHTCVLLGSATRAELVTLANWAP